MVDDIKQKFDGVYGWEIKDGKVVQPQHSLPEAVKKRADYFESQLQAIEEVTELFGDSIQAKAFRNIIRKLHEPQKVVIPKFVAKWIEEAKNRGLCLADALASNSTPTEVDEWLYGEDDKNEETFARAWYDGYEIKQEKLYVITDGNKLYLKEFNELNAIIIIDDVEGAVDYAKRYRDKTKAQQAADNLGWIVKEVE